MNLSFTRTMLVAILAMLTSSITAQQKLTFESATDAVNQMGIGWNLGNTLDATGKKGKKCITVQDFETSWGQPVTTRNMIHKFAESGFGVIRIPVSWYPHMDKECNVDKAWMDRVQKIADYVLNEGMYCIIYVHHDTGKNGWLKADFDEYQKTSRKYKKLWTQIATRFNDYGSKLLFEGYNEILDKNGTWDTTSTANYTIANRLSDDFVSIVRTSGGNNLQRNLIITTYSANASDRTLSSLRLPMDVVKNHIIGEVHFYDPQAFCFPENEPKIYTPEYQEQSLKVINRIDEYSKKLGIPFIIGEIAAFDKGNLPEREKFAKLVSAECRKRKIAMIWWMGLLDCKTCEWQEPTIVKALFE